MTWSSFARPSVTRAELYEAIWTRTIEGVAKEFGISGVAVGKWCRSWRIPTPPRGYWAVLAVGGDVGERPPLPPDLTAEELAEIERRRVERRENLKAKEDARATEMRKIWAAEAYGELVTAARSGLREAASAFVDAVLVHLDALARHARPLPMSETLDALEAYLDAYGEALSATSSEHHVTPSIRQACAHALVHVLEVMRSTRAMAAKKKPKIRTAVTEALHHALTLVIDAINEPEPPRKWTRTVRPPPLPTAIEPVSPELREKVERAWERAGYRPKELPQRPAETSLLEWRKQARRKAREQVRRGRRGPYKRFSADELDAEKRRLEAAYFRGSW